MSTSTADWFCSSLHGEVDESLTIPVAMIFLHESSFLSEIVVTNHYYMILCTTCPNTVSKVLQGTPFVIMWGFIAKSGVVLSTFLTKAYLLQTGDSKGNGTIYLESRSSSHLQRFIGKLDMFAVMYILLENTCTVNTPTDGLNRVNCFAGLQGIQM